MERGATQPQRCKVRNTHLQPGEHRVKPVAHHHTGEVQLSSNPHPVFLGIRHDQNVNFGEHPTILLDCVAQHEHSQNNGKEYLGLASTCAYVNLYVGKSTPRSTRHIQNTRFTRNTQIAGGPNKRRLQTQAISKDLSSRWQNPSRASSY